MSSQASLFIPMTLPSSTFPPYLSIDRKSPWHVSALFSTALESMTLPSRLKGLEGRSQSLDEIAGALNVNGNQNIAKLQMTIGSKSQTNGDGRQGRLEARAQSRDVRMPSQNGLESDPETRDDDIAALDLDLFPTDEPAPTRGRPNTKATHIFGQAEAFRGDDDVRDRDDDDFDGQERARRRAAGLPIIHKTWTPLPFPLLDSFPHIYSHTPSSPSSTSVSVRTSLSTDTSVASRIKSLRNVIGRSIGVDEREALSNTLGEIAEAYEEGWDSGSDEDDD